MTRLRTHLIPLFVLAGSLFAFGSANAQAAVMTPGQHAFARQLAASTHLDGAVVKAWLLAENSGAYARKREARHNHNWLNLGLFDSAGRPTLSKTWRNPVSAAKATASFIAHHSQFRGIRNAAGKSRETQIRAIANSHWAMSGYNHGNDLRNIIKRYFARG